MSKTRRGRGPRNDCGCLTHSGPHWLYMVNYDRAKLRRWEHDGNWRALATEGVAVAGEIIREMLAAGMTETETIEQYLTRTGWPPEVIEQCKDPPPA